MQRERAEGSTGGRGRAREGEGARWLRKGQEARAGGREARASAESAEGGTWEWAGDPGGDRGRVVREGAARWGGAARGVAAGSPAADHL